MTRTAPARPGPGRGRCAWTVLRRSGLALLTGLTLALSVAVVPAPAAAGTQEITPSLVFQLTEDLNGVLAALHRANLTRPATDAAAPRLAPRRPRHVYQKAREVFFKVQKLRFLNGLDQVALPPPPGRDILPKDVFGLVRAASESLRALLPVFDVRALPASASFVAGKTPTDVYANLHRASLALDGLGIPRVAPNDVMRIALTIVDDLKLILAEKGISPQAAPAAAPPARKEPGDVYAKGTQLLDRIRRLGDSRADLRPEGGVVLSPEKTGRITPADVQDRLQTALAEVMSIKVAAGIDAPTRIAPPQSGKSPSDVYAVLETATAMVDLLLRG
ncbi:MAG: hypothetical protein H6907_13835 [Hyphomicrobiales bacterium]|nr:hypothetical protein [Hyphomicrobiales bacterium]MCP5372803.1 hypothetical protein [Hyphomicrobiales bacterium]